MKRVSADITMRTATEVQIMDFLESRYPDVKASVCHPPGFVGALYEHSSDIAGWSTVGKSSSGGSLWSFWVNGLDLEHLRTIDAKPITITPEPVAKVLNCFEQLTVDEGEQFASSQEEEQDEGQEGDMSSFLFARPDNESWEDLSDSGSDIDSITTEGLIVTPPQVIAAPSVDEVIQEKALILDYFNLSSVPRIPMTDRELKVLLTDGDVWSFSAKERQRVAESVAGQAKADIDEDSIVLFESLAKRHEAARKQYAEARDIVSPMISPTRSELTDARSASLCGGA